MRVEGQTFIASYRQVIDLQDFDRSRFVHPLGQSGQLLSGHYGDLHELWRSVSYVPMRFSQSAVDAAVTRRLRLEP
jgi:penicillin amidase